MILDQPVLSSIAALAATFLALSLLVQVIQEIYKYLSSSQERSYRMALIDFLGPWADRIFEEDMAVDLKIRGPFQKRTVVPPARLLPLDKDDLTDALERTLSPWHREALQALRIERRLQEEQAEKGGSHLVVSPALASFIRKLTTAARGSPGYQAARDIYGFLQKWMNLPEWSEQDEKPPVVQEKEILARQENPVDARAVLTAYSARFLPHITRAADNYSQLMRNVEYSYRRRNLRQTFVFAFMLAVLFELPFCRLYQQAREMPADAAWRALSEATAAYDSTQASGRPVVPQSALPRTTVGLAEKLKAMGDSTKANPRAGDGIEYASLLRGAWRNIGQSGVVNGISYILGSLITALLICFGAPLWNDIAKSILRLKKGPLTDPDSAEAHT